MAKVIVKFISGDEKTGNVLIFNMNKSTFSLQVENKEGKTESLAVRTDSVKAIFFLKREDTIESHLRRETIEQSQFASSVAFKLMVEFMDGEIINGTTIKYNPDDKGFFLVPLNPADISERIYINARAVKNVDCKRLFGKILVDQKKITPSQLESSLMYQDEIKKKKIGTILIEEEIINKNQLNISLEKQKERSRLLGEILLEAGYITPEQLQHALRIQQKNRKKKLGQILVELKYVTPNDICIALASQLHYRWIDLSKEKIPHEVAAILPKKVVKKLEVIPVERIGDNVIVVATSQPQEQNLRSKIEKFTPLKVELVIAYEEYIESAIKEFFASKK